MMTRSEPPGLSVPLVAAQYFDIGWGSESCLRDSLDKVAYLVNSNGVYVTFNIDENNAIQIRMKNGLPAIRSKESGSWYSIKTIVVE